MRHNFANFDGVSNIELQFTDILGRLKAIDTSPERYVDAIDDGKVFDGSSLNFAPIECSDLILKPIAGTEFKLPWDPDTARVLCDIYDSDGKVEEFPLSPRTVLKKQIERARKIGYEPHMAVENEFFILKDGEPIDKHGYFSVTPLDETKPFRKKLFKMLPSYGISVEYMHHEVAQGQAEITLKVQNALKMADNVVTFKYFGQNIADSDGLIMTLMPKFRYGINGSGLHYHMSLADPNSKKNLFYDEKDSCRLSEIAKNSMAGLLEHYKSLTGLAAPSINSRKRLVPGYEAPINKAWGGKNRSALIRIPSFSSENGARIEYRAADSTGNIYLSFAGVLAAMIEGIEKKLDPEEPYTENTYEHERDFIGKTLPGTQEEVLEELEKDPLIKETLGEKLFENYMKVRRDELVEYKEFNRIWDVKTITPWELEKYLIL